MKTAQFKICGNEESCRYDIALFLIIDSLEVNTRKRKPTG